jgi:uncharacterized protein
MPRPISLPIGRQANIPYLHPHEDHMNSTTRVAAAAICFAGLAMAADAEARPTALPAPVEQRNAPVAWTATGPNGIAIDAPAQTNWFVSPSDLKAWDNAPTLLFRPDENFKLSARISLTPHSRWDSGALVLFTDPDHWAKLCLEDDQDDGRLSVVMVVTNGVSDDSYSIAASGNALYMKVAKSGLAFFFYASEDGKTWKMVRTFRLGEINNLKTGFLAQSPVGNGIHVEFSDIRYDGTP